jgi:hypothetical protein
MFGTPLHEAHPGWGTRAMMRVPAIHTDYPLPFGEQHCALLTVEPKAGGKACDGCGKRAHLAWRQPGQQGLRASCLDCLAGKRPQTCYVCDQESTDCLSGGAADRRIVVCVRCLFDAVNYVAALRSAADDLQDQVAKEQNEPDSETESESEEPEPAGWLARAWRWFLSIE